MNKNNFKKGFIQHHFGVGKSGAGFTLIELLVVIDIIGILASVLLVNLAGTRNRAKDSAIKLEMGQIRTALESFSLTYGTYVNGCTAASGGADCANLQADITGKQGGTAGVTNLSLGAYCVQYTLNSLGGDWCIDSTGYAGVPLATSPCTSTDTTCK